MMFLLAFLALVAVSQSLVVPTMRKSSVLLRMSSINFSDALGKVTKAVDSSVNYLKSVDEKLHISEKVIAAIPENETVDKLKATVSNAATKFKEIDAEYHLTDKSKEAIAAAATFTVAAIDKASELDQKYHIVDNAADIAKKAASTAFEKIKEQAK